MRTAVAAALAWSLSAAAAGAQPSAPPSVGTRMATPHAAVASLLESSDPIDQAWGASLAVLDGRRDLQPQLEAVVAAGLEPGARRASLPFALDALIQLRADVPLPLLERIADGRPMEALILIAQRGDAAPDITLRILERVSTHEWFAAANLLLRQPPPGFAARLLTGLRLEAEVTISDSDSLIGRGSGTYGCMGCGAFGSAPGMPPWPVYSLTSLARADAVLLAAGPTPVSYVRHLAPAGSIGSASSDCSGTPTGRDRLRYATALTGQTLPVVSSRVVRRSDALDRAALVAGVRREREREHAQYVRDLVAGGHLTPAEADAVTVQIDVRLYEP